MPRRDAPVKRASATATLGTEREPTAPTRLRPDPCTFVARSLLTGAAEWGVAEQRQSPPCDPAAARAPADRRRAGRRWAAGRDPLERPARAGRGLQWLARRRIVVARADRAGLLQGRRNALARPRLSRPDRRDVAPGAALRLSREGQTSADRRSQDDGQGQEEPKERHHEDERLDIVGAR